MKKKITYQGNSLSYHLETLDKPICLCLHGMNMTSEMFKTKQMKHLLKDYSLVLIDLCGYGDAVINYDNFDMEIFNELLTRLLIHEKIKHCSLAGYCLGGVFALDYTIRNPQIIDHLILIETMIYLPKWLILTMLPGYQSGYRLFQRQVWLLKLLEICPSFQNISSPVRIKLSQAKWDGALNSFYLRMMHRYEQENHLKRCQAIYSPVDIIFSQSSFKQVKQTAIALSKYSFVTIHRCMASGHFLFLDEALEKITLTL